MATEFPAVVDEEALVEAMQAAVRGAASDATGAARDALLQLMRIVHAANPKLAQAITRTLTPNPNPSPNPKVVGSSAEQQAHRQLATIYFEALCGFLTFSDGHVYRRRRADRTLHELPMGTLQNINCTAAATHESRVAGTR